MMMMMMMQIFLTIPNPNGELSVKLWVYVSRLSCRNLASSQEKGIPSGYLAASSKSSEWYTLATASSSNSPFTSPGSKAFSEKYVPVNIVQERNKNEAGGKKSMWHAKAWDYIEIERTWVASL
jgi:hypothetical protein